MGFREFITNRLYRKKLQAEFDDIQNIQPPANLGRPYINKLVERLLSEKHTKAAQVELKLIGRDAAPSLLAALRDPKYQEEAMIYLLLELLVPHSPDHVAAAAMPLIRSSSSSIRKTAALHLASLGRDDSVPLLAELLNDVNGYVRAYVMIGAQRALAEGRCGEGFRRSMYELLLAQCDKKWEVALNDAASAVVELDRARATVDFASERWLSPSNPNVHQILEACNQTGILLPEKLVRRLLDHSLPLAIGERCYPHQYVVGGALEALARRLGEQIKPLLEELLASDQEKIRESAAKGLAKIAGLEDPVNYVIQRAQKVGFEGLTAPERVVYCGFLFDAEVCNGGIMQFFGNTSGDRAVETLEALRVLNLPEAFNGLDTAMNLVGPLSREPDRDMRLTAFEGRYDELQAGFEPLEHAYYATKGLLRQRILLYAVANADHFQSPSPIETDKSLGDATSTPMD